MFVCEDDVSGNRDDKGALWQVDLGGIWLVRTPGWPNLVENNEGGGSGNLIVRVERSRMHRDLPDVTMDVWT